MRLPRTRLLPFFSNLLPEGALRDYLARKAGVHPGREFFLLRALGRDLPVAVTVETENFMDVWSDRKAAREADPDLFGPIARHLLRIPLVREVGFQFVQPESLKTPL
jgi:serine/threonine-protein kinase HipA